MKFAVYSLPFQVLLLLACAADTSGGPRESCRTRTDCADGQACVDGRCTSDIDVGPDEIAEIYLEPSSAELVAVDGAEPEQAFSVIATLGDGSMTPVTDATLVLDSRRIGSMVGDRFVANGTVGGEAVLTATVRETDGRMVTAEATVAVRVERTIVGEGTPADAPTRFEGDLVTDPERAAQVLYPLSGAVMPQNVYPPDIQWERSAVGDVFRVTAEKPHGRVVAYVAHAADPFRKAWLVEEEVWRGLAQTDPDTPLEITVDRWEAATGSAIASEPVTVTLARAELNGSVYYWDIAAGRIVRIDDGTATRESFMPTPPLGVPAEPGVAEAPCVGCHTVSNSGRYMAGRLSGGENIGAVFDLSKDLTGAPPPTEFPIRTTPPRSTQWWFSTWSPDDTRLAISQFENPQEMSPAQGGNLEFMDPFTGTVVPVTGTKPTDVTHPAWSPDGTQIAYVTNLDGWGGQNTTGDIATVDVVGPDMLGDSRVIHSGASLAGSDPGGNADSYPDWTPDSARIAFAHGTGSRSDARPGVVPLEAIRYSALYIMNRDGSGVVRLDAATGPTSDAFQPRFSPFDEGGYYWLSFLSRRDYGNAVAGTRGTTRQQIWVTAIKKDAAPGEDPSEVGYWLPGQDTQSMNISAFWAPRPPGVD